MRSVLLLALLALLSAACVQAAWLEAETESEWTLSEDPTAALLQHDSYASANPAVNTKAIQVATQSTKDKERAHAAAVAAASTPVASGYATPVDVLGPFGNIPINPTAHLQRSLEEDNKYIAAIMRAPYDFGDPAACTHSDVVRDEKALRQIALRINARRVALRQQQHWIDMATEGLNKVQLEISTTAETARNLAEQLDALNAQRADIANHVRRAMLLKELETTSNNLMRLKDARTKAEVQAQVKHNEFAVRNHEHNQVLEKMHQMRTKGGLALGKLHDPKPYRFKQIAPKVQEDQPVAAIEMSSEADAESKGETEVEGENETESEAEAEAEAEEQE